MASAASRAIAVKATGTETIVNFDAERIRAPFVLRCAALIIDYLILIAVPVAWLLVSTLLSETPSDVMIGSSGWAIGFVLFVANFLVLPLLRGRTIGKMMLGLTILKVDGAPVDLVGVLRRNILGYLATVLTFGVGFLIAAVNTSGRSLHDFIGGTVVVRGRKTPKES